MPEQRERDRGEDEYGQEAGADQCGRGDRCHQAGEYADLCRGDDERQRGRLQRQFYGDRDGHIVDPFGHGWTVASHIEDVIPEELMRRMAELFGSAGS